MKCKICNQTIYLPYLIDNDTCNECIDFYSNVRIEEEEYYVIIAIEKSGKQLSLKDAFKILNQ